MLHDGLTPQCKASEVFLDVDRRQLEQTAGRTYSMGLESLGVKILQNQECVVLSVGEKRFPRYPWELTFVCVVTPIFLHISFPCLGPNSLPLRGNAQITSTG